MTEPSDFDAQTLWQSQSDGDATMSLDDIRRRARSMERAVSRRNLLEYIAAAVVVAAFGGKMWGEPSAFVRASSCLVIAAALFVVYQLHRRGAATRLPSDLALKNSIEFHRAQLERQRDLVRSVWSWYLLPFMPGLLGLQIGLARSRPTSTPKLIAQVALILVTFAAVHGLNRWAAGCLQRRIDRLKDHS